MKAKVIGAMAAVVLLAGAAHAGVNTIQKFTPDGVGSVFATFTNDPILGMAFDRAGNLYVAHQYTGTIEKLTPNGGSTVFATTPWPDRMAFSSSGDLYVSSSSDGTIRKFTPDGVGTVFAIGLRSSYGLAFDRADNLYVSNYISVNGSIDKFTPDGARSVFYDGGIYGGSALAFDSAGNLYMGFYGGVAMWTPEGVRSVRSSSVWDPFGLAFDSADNLFVTASRSMIKKITPDGASSIFVTGLHHPWDIAFDSAGNLYVSNAETIDLPNGGGAVPEPASVVCGLIGLGMIGGYIKKRRAA